MRLESAMLPMKGDRISYSQQQPNKSYGICTQKHSKFYYINVTTSTGFQSAHVPSISLILCYG